MSSTWNSLLNLIFPPGQDCPICSGPSQGGALCSQCAGLMEKYGEEQCCVRCGRLPASGAAFYGQCASHFCQDCRKEDWPFVLARAAFPYEGVFREAVHRYKYAGKRALSRPLAGLMVAVAQKEPLYLEAGLIIPVPLTPEKTRLRGFNQAELLAREVGEQLKIPVKTDWIVKTVETTPQAGLSRLARKTNLENAFKFTGKSSISGIGVLIVDDVFTTGSTMSAVATAARAAGAGRVFGLTAATGRCL